jgi:hypothetical protein
MTPSPKVKNELLDAIAEGAAIIIHQERQEIEASLRLLRDEVAVLRARLDAGAIDSDRLTDRLRAELAIAKAEAGQRPN